MSTSFVTSFDTDDIVEASHVTQFATPINNMEKGLTWFAVTGGSSDAYTADFSSGANSLDASTLAAGGTGRIFHLKANHSNSGPATLQINGTASSSFTAAITKSGGNPLTGGELVAGQMFMLLLDIDESPDRFELISGSGSSALTSGQIGFGDSNDELTGEASFTYDSTNDRLQVEHIQAGSAGSGEISCPGAGTDTEQFGASVSAGSYDDGVAVGNAATLSGNAATAVGKDAAAEASGVAVGNAAIAGQGSVSIGLAPNADAGPADFGVFIGQLAGFDATGDFNTVVGFEAGLEIGSGTHNAFLGTNAGKFQSGTQNVFLGYLSGFGVSSSSTGSYNTALGTSSLYSLTTGTHNVAVGYGSLYSLTTSTGSVALGSLAGQYQTGANNTFLGNQSGLGVSGSSSGQSNTLIGRVAGQSLTGSYNTFTGASVGAAATASGSFNTGNGYGSIYNLTSGSANAALGSYSLWSVTEGEDNVALGPHAGYSCQTGDKNVFIGHEAGYSETGSNKLYIDNSNTANPLIHGEFDNNNIGFNGKDYKGGNGVIFIANATTAPTTNPSGGGILYVSGGNLYFRGSSGSAVQIN